MVKVALTVFALVHVEERQELQELSEFLNHLIGTFCENSLVFKTTAALNQNGAGVN